MFTGTIRFCNRYFRDLKICRSLTYHALTTGPAPGTGQVLPAAGKTRVQTDNVSGIVEQDHGKRGNTFPATGKAELFAGGGLDVDA